VTGNPAKSRINKYRRGFILLLWILPLALFAVAYRFAGGFEFVGDARFLIQENLFLRDHTPIWSNALHNYFWSSSGNAIPYWRPLTKLSFALEYRWFGDWAGGYAYLQTAFHALGIIGVQLLARRIGVQPGISAVAAIVYALHPVTIAPVCLIMARSDVVVTTASIWAVWSWLQWHSCAYKPIWALVHTLSFAVALASKEVGVVLPAVLLCFVLVQKDSMKRKVIELATVVPSAVLSIAFLIARHVVLESDVKRMGAVSLEFNPLRIFAGLTIYLQNIVPFALRSGVRDISVGEATGLAAWFAVARGDRCSLALLFWFGTALAPVLLTSSINVPTADSKFVAADRWLLFGLPAAVLLGARLVENLGHKQLRTAVTIGAAVWTALLIIDASGARAEFASEMGLLNNEDRLYYEIPEAYRSAEDDCRFRDRKAVRALTRSDFPRVVQNSRYAMERCGDKERLRAFRLFSALVQLKRFSQAKPLADDLIASPPPGRMHAALSQKAALVYLNTGEPERAEALLIKSMKLGYRSCQTWVWLAEAARKLREPALAATRLESGFECGLRRDPSLLLMASSLRIQSGELRAAAELLKKARHGYRLKPDQAAFARQLQATLDENRTELSGLSD
jgi:hypothetical protein